MSRTQKLLLTIHASYGLAATMSGLFLNLYLWRIANDLAVNAIFNLVTFAFGTLAFWIGGKISKQKDRLITYQLGVGLTALFYLFVILLQEKVASMPEVLGVVNGLAAGFYWLGFLILLYDLVDIESRSSFLGKQMAVFGVVNTLGPALAGFVISQFDYLGYNLIFGLSFLLFIAGVILSFRLPKDDSPKKKLKMGLLWRYNRRYTNLRSMWLGWMVWGTCEGLILFLPPLLLFMAVNDEFMVGLVTIVLGSIAILTSLWHSKYNHKEREPYTVLVMWISYFIACLPVFFIQNIWSVLFFLVINEISKALIGVSYFSYMLRNVGALPKRAGMRVESMVMREIMLNAGRVISVVTFILLYNWSQESIFTLLFVSIVIQGILFKIMGGSLSIQGNPPALPPKVKVPS